MGQFGKVQLTMPLLAPEYIEQRIYDAWPDAHVSDCFMLYPLGSRNDYLIFNRAIGRVTTGRRGEGPCFEGSLDDFAEKLEDDYGQRLETPYGSAETITRRRDEYRAALVLLRALATIRTG